jgi:hypothetical protein
MTVIPTISLPSTPLPSPPPIIFPAPLSYEFQVVEHVDDSGKITKVALQVKCNQHDQYGCISVHGTWADVPRVQLKF